MLIITEHGFPGRPRVVRRSPTEQIMPITNQGDLTRVIRSWPKLSPETRGAVLQIVQEATTLPPGAVLSEMILRAAEDIEPAFRLPGGPLVCFAHLRRHPTLKAMPKVAFDRAVIHLAETGGRIALHHHDHALRLPQDERDALVTDGERHFIGISSK